MVFKTINRYNFLILALITQISFAQSTNISSEFKKKVEVASSELFTSPSDPMNPVSVNATLVWSEDKTQVAIVLKANIGNEWHIYAYVPENQPYIASRLELELPSGIKAIGEWEKPYSESYGDDIYVYRGALVFVQYCSVGYYTKGSKINCGLHYQTCNLRKCFPPQTKSKSFKL
ncbi:protein-disulfide reductase DsbD N-terminal domain-containing protein [Sabulilitoribacter arenilitoris]|uniref:Protein-disulfide reductase DsbD N-terminal domain-containing protein n=1 Tax=Wocania arenilitoris TaxID=2044858 RepID=A0AAE3JLH5_9FLAO|nr:protein-disulfide reductase DsbD domain-containing protein [Wocania arenilitoris]MCF7568284.1 protein-disulfide reductase DsbD N-terminal domain-containing protein [Wocania arenilitoris]